MFFKKNYSAWNIKEKNYPGKEIDDQIKFLLGYAILAPSTFNSQPWKCKAINNYVEVYLDQSRMLKKSDKTGRFAYITMGCFLENLVIAAKHFRWQTKLRLESKKDANLIKVATVSLIGEVNSNNKDQLFKAITKRATNRSLHISREVPRKVLQKIKTFADKNQKVFLLSRQFANKLIPIAQKGDLEIWGNEQIRREHSAWVRHNLTLAYAGMPAFGVGIGLWKSFLSKKIMVSPIFPQIQAKKNAQTLEHSQNFAVLCCKDQPLSWIKLGMLYQEISLYLTNFGVALVPIATLIESSQARNDLSKLLKNATFLKPQIFFRFGYPSKPVSHSPRLPVEKILINS